MYEDSRAYGLYGQDFNYTIRRDDPEARSATVPAENFITDRPICFEPLENTITVRTPAHQKRFSTLPAAFEAMVSV